MTPSELARFERHIAYEPNSGCWLWTGVVSGFGYGRMTIGSRAGGAKRRQWSTHRLSYAHFRGPIPDGLLVCHRCDVPACVNPDHLWLGTQSENLLDMSSKGRHAAAAKPERVSRGDRHWTRASPEKRLRGERHGGAKLTESDVREIRASWAADHRIKPLVARFGVSSTLIDNIVRRVSWTHI